MVMFQSGETPIRSGPVTVFTQGGPRPGVLTLTNMYLVFEPSGAAPPQGEGWGGGGGPASNEYRIGLWRVRQAQAGPGPGGKVLQVNLLARVLTIQVDDINAWAAAVNQAHANAPPPPPEVAERQAMRKAGKAGPGAPMPPRRCTYCGRLSAATATKCESCGAPF